MNRIKELRLSKNLSQTDLASAINVHQTAISQWEKKRTSPDMSTAIILADYFDVSIDYLLGVSGIRQPKSDELTIPEEMKNAKVAFNRGELEGLTQEEVEKVAEFAKFLKSQRKEV